MKVSKIIKKMKERSLDKNPNKENKKYNLHLYEHFNDIMNKIIFYLQLSNETSIKWEERFNKIIDLPDKEDYFTKWNENVEKLYEEFQISPEFDQFIKRSI